MPMNPRLLRPIGPRGRFRSLRVGLVAYWPLNEDAPSGDVTAEDWTGRGNDLTSNNSVLSVAGKIGNAREFVAANSEGLVAAGNNADLRFMDGRDWTFSFWFNLSSWPAGNMAFVSRDGVAAGEREVLCIAFTSSNRHRLSFETGPGTSPNTQVQVLDQVTAGDRLPLNTWNFLAFTYNSATRVLAARLNAGTLTGQTSSGTLPAGTPVVGTRPLNLGRRPAAAPDLFLTGQMDEVAKWDRVLSSAELDTLWNNGAGIDLRQ
jgi:hypothetical protein